MMEWNKICHLYRKSVSILPVTVPKGWEVHPSKTPYYLITTWCKKPKNEHHENLKSYHLHLHHYAPGGCDSVCGTVTFYMLNGLEFKSQWGCDFFCSHLDQPQGPSSLLHTEYWVALTTQPHLAPLSPFYDFTACYRVN